MRSILSRKRPLHLVAILAVALLCLSGCRSIFGAAEGFTLLAGKSIQASLPVAVDGQIGAGTGIVNVTGTVADSPTRTQALSDIAASQAKLRRLMPQQETSGASLLSGPVAPGFYHVSGSLVIPAGQTLNLQSDGLYVFNIDGALTLGADASVVLNGGLKAENVIWNAATGASIGTNVDFNGIVVAESDISFGANAQMVGRLLSRTGSISIDSGNILDAATSGGFPAAVSTPQTAFTVVPGQPVKFTVAAGFPFPLGFGEVGLFVKGLPPGATQSAGDGVVDQSGPNGSDLINIQDLSGASPAVFTSDFSWVPTIPGTYHITYFVRSNSLFTLPSSVALAPTAGDLNGPIDACTVTITVGFPTTNVGVVTGGGMWGLNKTFHVTAASRGGRRPLVVGTFQAMLAPGVILRSRSIHTLVRTDLGGARRSVQLFGTAAAGRYGVVPFTALFVDGGPRGQDTVSVSLTVDPAQNGGNSQLDFTGILMAGSLNIR